MEHELEATNLGLGWKASGMNKNRTTAFSGFYGGYCKDLFLHSRLTGFLGVGDDL